MNYRLRNVTNVIVKKIGTAGVVISHPPLPHLSQGMDRLAINHDPENNPYGYPWLDCGEPGGWSALLGEAHRRDYYLCRSDNVAEPVDLPPEWSSSTHMSWDPAKFCRRIHPNSELQPNSRWRHTSIEDPRILAVAAGFVTTHDITLAIAAIGALNVICLNDKCGVILDKLESLVQYDGMLIHENRSRYPASPCSAAGWYPLHCLVHRLRMELEIPGLRTCHVLGMIWRDVVDHMRIRDRTLKFDLRVLQTDHTNLTRSAPPDILPISPFEFSRHGLCREIFGDHPDQVTLRDVQEGLMINIRASRSFGAEMRSLVPNIHVSLPHWLASQAAGLFYTCQKHELKKKRVERRKHTRPRCWNHPGHVPTKWPVRKGHRR